MSFITLIIVISVLVFVHEFGHFIVAKRSGVRVDEFSIGFPPRIWSFKKGETTYSINIIPFGGFVKIFGENPDAESMSGPDSSRSFVKKNRAIQAAILIAGIAMNVIFAWLLLSASYMIGVTQAIDAPTAISHVIVTDIVPNSPAAKSGLKAGDIVLAMSTAKIKSATTTSENFMNLISNSKGAPVLITYQEGKIVATTSVAAVTGIVPDKVAIGVGMADVDNIHYGFFRSLYEGASATWDLALATASGTFAFLGSLFEFHANLADVSGPVGIAGYLNTAREYGISTLFSFVALISLNLAVVNLLPFPALDGGRLLFVAIEVIIRRPLNPKIANTINLIGFALLLILMAVITFSDIAKLVK